MSLKLESSKSCLAKATGADRSFLTTVCRAQVKGEEPAGLLLLKSDLIATLEEISFKYPSWSFLKVIITQMVNTSLSDTMLIVQESREEMLRGTWYLHQDGQKTLKTCLFENKGLHRYCLTCPVGRMARERYLTLHNPDNPDPLHGWGSK